MVAKRACNGEKSWPLTFQQACLTLDRRSTLQARVSGGARAPRSGRRWRRGAGRGQGPEGRDANTRTRWRPTGRRRHRLHDRGAPDALRCGPQAAPIQRVTRRQRWRRDSFRHESCVAVFSHHTLFLPYGPLRRCDVPMQQSHARAMVRPGLPRVPSVVRGYLIITELTRTCLCQTAHMACLGG